MDTKLAIQFIKSELDRLKIEARTHKTKFRTAQRCASIIFKNDCAYGHFTPDWRRITWRFDGGCEFRYMTSVDKNSKLDRRPNESDESYQIRLKMVLDYLTASPYNALPRGKWHHHTDIMSDEITCLHILYNKLRNKKSHVKNEDKYVNSKTYKAILQRVEDNQKVSETTQEGGC